MLMLHLVLRSTLVKIKYLYQVYETLKKLCEFSTVWADWADLGSTKTAKQSLSIQLLKPVSLCFHGQKMILFYF